MFLAAVLRTETEQAPVRVRNMSSLGAMVDSPLGPPAGTQIHLLRGPLLARGTVMWSSAKRCGLRFTSELSVKDWLAAPASVEQSRVDELVALIRAGGTSDRVAGADDPCTLAHRKAEEQTVADLGSVIGLIEALEDDLASCQATVARHGLKLQNLDIAMQMIRAIAHDLSPAEVGKPQSLAKLEDLRVACSQALGVR
jgi:hypothetical protein